MHLIPAEARIVVVGDPGPLKALSDRVGDRHGSLIEFRPVQDFLLPYDLATLEGEARRRTMEALYASLRGKIIVRLLIANLNPEAIRLAGEAPLKRLRREWGTIRSRMPQLLSEASDDGVVYVSIIVTEEGEWRPEFRADLIALVGTEDSGDLDSSASARPPSLPHRCYLMTRILELGASSVIFAKDAWPDLVSGLIDYFRLVSVKDTVRREALRPRGLYAWRTVRFVAGIEDSYFEHSIAQAIAVANEELLRTPSEPLFGPLPENLKGDLGSVDACSEPEGLLDADAFTKPQLIDAGLIAHYGDPGIWDPHISRHADEVREAIWSEFRTELKAAHLGSVEAVQSVQQRVTEAHMGIPGRVFPGSLGEIRVTDRLDGPALSGVRAAKEESAIRQARLAGYLRAHVSAARAFVPSRERLVIGLALGMAICFSVLMISVLASGWAGAGLQGWLLGAWLAAWGLAGVATSLLAGFLLQRKRLRDACRHIQSASEDWVEAQKRIPTRTGEVLALAGKVAAMRARRASRKMLHHRLMRIQTVLQNEMQPVAGFEPSPSSIVASSGARSSAIGITDYPVDVDFTAKFAEDALKSFVEKELVGKFKDDWQNLLKTDPHKIGFLPVSGLLELATKHAERLVRGVRSWLRVQRVDELKSMGSNHPELVEAWSKAIDDAQVGKTERPTRFFSVDLPTGAPSAARLFVLKEFEGPPIEKIRTTRIAITTDSGLSDLGPGVLGFWYGDVQLDFSELSKGAIRFVAEARSGSSGNGAI
jgi:hypothetical protein